MTKMRAKMTIHRIEKTLHNETLVFNCVGKKGSYGDDGLDEDNTFAKFSPWGELKLTVANPALIGQFQCGETYYLDFIKAE